MIVATAGHVDHGKTRLVRALTGVDTDRLPEERARGISIDLGFAHADLAGDSGTVRVSFIDVPGHERFIRNMLAGVCAIDAALLIVAADDGVMPQTLEHLHILDLLDVRHGAVVITKTDLVPRARVTAVTAEVQALLATTTLAGVDTFALSSASGVGLPALRAWLRSAALDEVSAVTELSEVSDVAGSDDGRVFRLAIDRVFTVAGSGTVVTGTVHSGSVTTGDALVISPAGHEVRVRGVQVQGAPASHALPGQRCALNLAGVGVDDVRRGDWVLHARAHTPTSRLDARLRVLTAAAEPLQHWTPVHLHLGTASVTARIAVPAEGSVAPGTSAHVQLVPDRPLAALHGDRFVVRDQGARHTLGGGVVLDPLAPRRPRRAALRHAELEVLERRTPAAILGGLLELAGAGVDLDSFARRLGLTADAAAALPRAVNAVVLGRSPALGLTRESIELLSGRLLAALSAFHAGQPQAVGMDAATLRAATAPRLPMAAFHALLRELANRRSLVLSNDVVRLHAHDATANAVDEQLWTRVQAALAQAGVHVPLLTELAASLNVKEPTLRDFLHRKSKTGDVLRLTPERFVMRQTLARLAATAVRVARDAEGGVFSAAQFRDAIGTGRGLAIHILEFFDRLGLTQRSNNLRRTGKDFVPLLGAAEALPSPDPAHTKETST